MDALDLAARKTELQRMGFRLLAEDATSFVAVRSKWYWECMFTKMTTLVVVRRVANVTAEDIGNDAKWILTNADKMDPSGLPTGFQKGRIYLTVYLADRVDDSAWARAAKKPWADLGTFFVPAVRDANRSEFFRGTRIWGAVYYPIFQFLLGRLVEPWQPAPDKEPLSTSGMVMTLLVLFMLIGMCLCLPAGLVLAGAMR
ncbi:MAG: hypothetical protein R3B99_26705 [Polyangiales bacterium]